MTSSDNPKSVTPKNGETPSLLGEIAFTAVAVAVTGVFWAGFCIGFVTFLQWIFK